MQVKTVRLTDPETGETNEMLLEDTTRRAGGKPRVRFSSGYAITFEDALRRIARDRNITGTMHRVLAALLVVAPVTGEPFHPDSEKVARLTRMTKQRVANTYGALVTQGLLTRPRHGYLAFNPAYFWRGPAETRERALAEQVQATIITDPVPLGDTTEETE